MFIDIVPVENKNENQVGTASICHQHKSWSLKHAPKLQQVLLQDAVQEVPAADGHGGQGAYSNRSVKRPQAHYYHAGPA